MKRTPETAIPLRRALAEWLRTTEIEATTRRTYVGYIERTIDPALAEQLVHGRVPGRLFHQGRPQLLGSLRAGRG